MRGIELFNKRPDGKFTVEFNAEGRQVREHARPLATLCGLVVRTPGIAPIQVKKWAEIPQQAKEKMWRQVHVISSKNLGKLFILFF